MHGRTRLATRTAAVLLACILFAGCAPARFTVPWIAQIEDSVPNDTASTPPLFVVTDRMLTDRGFTKVRGDVLILGTETCGRFTLLGGLSNTQAATDAAPFADALDAALAQTIHGDVFIFVHGYRNSLETGCRAARNFGGLLTDEGVAIAYCWPSANRLRGYPADVEAVQFTTPHLRQLLAFLAERTTARRIHLVGHSTGAAVVAAALRELRLIHHVSSETQLRDALRIGEVALVSPDIDPDLFREQFVGEGVPAMASGVTVYASSRDRALAYAESQVYRRPRLGRAVAELKAAAGVTLIDASDVGTAGFGRHSHHTRNPAAGSDLLLLLRNGGSPALRGLTQRADGWWTFPDDYRDRLTRLASPASGSLVAELPATPPQ